MSCKLISLTWFKHYASTEYSTHSKFVGSKVYVYLSVTFPPALLAKWPRFFMCHCGGIDTEWECTERKKKILLPHLPGWYLLFTSPALYQLSCSDHKHTHTHTYTKLSFSLFLSLSFPSLPVSLSCSTHLFWSYSLASVMYIIYCKMVPGFCMFHVWRCCKHLMRFSLIHRYFWWTMKKFNLQSLLTLFPSSNWANGLKSSKNPLSLTLCLSNATWLMLQVSKVLQTIMHTVKHKPVLYQCMSISECNVISFFCVWMQCCFFFLAVLSIS